MIVCLYWIRERLVHSLVLKKKVSDDASQIAEFDTPANLIKKEGGIFRDMCLKSGSFEELRMASNAAAMK